MIEETAAYIGERGMNKIALLATDGTVQTGLYQQALSGRKLNYLVPDEAAQQAVMKTIYDIKAGCDLKKAKQTFAPAIKDVYKRQILSLEKVMSSQLWKNNRRRDLVGR